MIDVNVCVLEKQCGFAVKSWPTGLDIQPLELSSDTY